MVVAMAGGNGGTGKTSLVASLAAPTDDAVLVDCNVETPDLHLVLAPQKQKSSEPDTIR